MERRLTDWNFTLWLLLVLGHVVVVLTLVILNAMKKDANASGWHLKQRSMENPVNHDAKTLNFPGLFFERS